MTLAGFSAPFWKALLGKLQLFGMWLAGFGVFGFCFWPTWIRSSPDAHP
jgi:hypothetical protein